MRGTKKIIVRLFQFGLMILAQAIYLPLNQNLSGGYQTRIWLDSYIPILPVWTIPYVLWLPVCLFFAFWAAMNMEDFIFKAYFTGAMVTIFSSMLIFALFPTYVIRPEVTGNGIFSNMLRSVYQNDQLYNALPSGHVYLVVFTALFYICWQSSRSCSLKSIIWLSWRTWFWIGMIVIVCLSALFTGQHSIIDIPGGAVMAILGYYSGWWWAGKRQNVPKLAGADEISKPS
jgi:membrane-associated phospholipid phosphatase